MAITNLTGYTWVYATGMSLGSMAKDTTFNLNFTSNSINYTTWLLENYTGSEYRLYYGSTTVFDSDMGGWILGSAYQTIRITGGTDATNTTLIAALEATGILTPPAGYNVTFVTNGGTSVAPLTLVEELPTPLPTTTKAGSIFVGWYYDTLLTQRAYSGDVITANITLYAKWYANMNEFYEDVADAIRSKTSETGLIKHTDFADKIRGIYEVVELTQAEYDALTTKNPNVYYLILEE